MEKFEILGVSNKENKIYISLKKIDFFEDRLKKILEKLGFENLHFCGCDECAPEKDLIDCWTNYKNTSYDIDIFYGKEKIVVVVRASAKNKNKFVEEIKKDAVWAKPIKLKKPSKVIDK